MAKRFETLAEVKAALAEQATGNYEEDVKNFSETLKRCVKSQLECLIVSEALRSKDIERAYYKDDMIAAIADALAKRTADAKNSSVEPADTIAAYTSPADFLNRVDELLKDSGLNDAREVINSLKCAAFNFKLSEDFFPLLLSISPIEFAKAIALIPNNGVFENIFAVQNLLGLDNVILGVKDSHELAPDLSENDLEEVAEVAEVEDNDYWFFDDEEDKELDEEVEALNLYDIAEEDEEEFLRFINSQCSNDIFAA